jgi:FtsP/CotA-like multicopper oxidase with cupredoxin domain
VCFLGSGTELHLSFHIIGTIFDRVYESGSLSTPPLAGVQTVTVPPGSAAVVELSLPVPGRFLLVDHALTRLERGLAGALIVEGPAAPEIFYAGNGGKTGAHHAKRPRRDDITRVEQFAAWLAQLGIVRPTALPSLPEALAQAGIE